MRRIGRQLLVRASPVKHRKKKNAKKAGLDLKKLTKEFCLTTALSNPSRTGA